MKFVLLESFVDEARVCADQCLVWIINFVHQGGKILIFVLPILLWTFSKLLVLFFVFSIFIFFYNLSQVVKILTELSKSFYIFCPKSQPILILQNWDAYQKQYAIVISVLNNTLLSLVYCLIFSTICHKWSKFKQSCHGFCHIFLPKLQPFCYFKIGMHLRNNTLLSLVHLSNTLSSLVYCLLHIPLGILRKLSNPMRQKVEKQVT